MNDADIVELYWSRDENAIRETERKYGAYCRTVAYNILHSDLDADECVNDTWLRAWQSIPPHRPALLSSYVAKLTRRLSIDRLRRETRLMRDRSLTVSFNELEDCIPCPDGTDTDGLREMLTDFLRQLDRTDRQLFVGRYWHAYSLADLAKGHGLTVNAVNMRLRRMRDKLRATLGKGGYDV